LRTINSRRAADVLDGVAELPDLEAAEWVLSIGGVVKVRGRDDIHQVRGGVAEGGVRSDHRDFVSHREVTDADLARLTKLADLEQLVLYHTPITMAGWFT